MMPSSEEFIIEVTQQWIVSFIIDLNICPFAKREIEHNSVKIHVSKANKIIDSLEDLLTELVFLDNNLTTETTLLIFPTLFNDFFHYLDFVDAAERLIHGQAYEGIYQLATFHPDYCFADTACNDPSNYTNRSPYPMIHILREHSLDKAIAYYGDTEIIPEKNIRTLQNLGLEKIIALLTKIRHKVPPKKNQAE